MPQPRPSNPEITAAYGAAQLGKFTDVPWDAFRTQIDQAHRALPQHVTRTAFVSAEGLVHNGDKVHFDADSARELGRRYAAAYLKLKPGSPESVAFVTKHKDALWRANGGK